MLLGRVSIKNFKLNFKDILFVFLLVLTCLDVGDLVRNGEGTYQGVSKSERTCQIIAKILATHRLNGRWQSNKVKILYCHYAVAG